MKNGYDLVGKTAFISGAGSGIGRTIAISLLEAGADVYICDVHPEHLSRFLEEHPSAKGRLADVGISEEVEAAFSDLDRSYGQLDILINNAGVSGPVVPVEKIHKSDWNRTLNVNLNGPFHCTQQAVPRIRKMKGGTILNIASNAAFTGTPLRSAYVASKWAMVGLTKTWAMELGRENIRVNAICPGSVEGPRIDGVIQEDAASRGLSTKEIRSLYQKQNSMGIFIQPEQISALATFLCSDSASMISGQAIGIDGHTESLGNWFD